MSLDGRELSLLKEMSESFGPSGFEIETASIVKKAGERFADEVLKDKLGSVIFRLKGKAERPRVLLAGHIDEVGFVITGIDEKSGFLTFNPLGGWFDQVLLGQRVKIRAAKGDVVGVIASKPPHLLSPDEREKVVKVNQMFIDVGARNRETVEEELGVKVGDPVAPSAEFITSISDRVVIGKAFDDRIGTFVGLQVMKMLREAGIAHPNTLFMAATVQEEVGLRGAQTVSHVVDPDVAVVLETDIAGDVPGIKQSEAPAKMGCGPSIITFDASMIPNQPLKRLVIETAEEEGIKYQLSSVARGGTDGGKFHLGRSGCPSIAICVPTRHIHSHSALAEVSDIEATSRLVVALVRKLDESRVEGLTSL